MRDFLENYEVYLISEEKSSGTIEKYIRDTSGFLSFAGEEEITKQTVIEYKEALALKYEVSTVNSILAAMNGFFEFIGRPELRVKPIKKQKSIFCRKDRELSREEYLRLLEAARKNDGQRLYMIMQTICSTGIRISELKYITAEAVRCGRAEVSCKGKLRVILLPKKLRKSLEKYISRHGIKEGPVFITKSGRPVSRGNVWRDMKKLCEKANVDKSKVFPHNLRHLFAKEFYRLEKDLAKLADILGHANIETTRIYIMENGENHERILEKMKLVV